MKTIKECLREADREELINVLSFEFISDPMNLWERRDQTVADLRKEYSEQMSDFIEMLLSLKEEKSEGSVVYLTKSGISHGYGALSLELCELDELEKDIDAPCCEFKFSEWEHTLGFLVADTKLTQDNLNMLLRLYLKESSVFGVTADIHAMCVDNIRSELEKAERDLIEKNSVPAEEMFDSIYKELGLPIPEKDPEEYRLRKKIVGAQVDYELYCSRRERGRILQGCGSHRASNPSRNVSNTCVSML